MRRLGQIGFGKLSVVGTLGIVLLVFVAFGQGMFSSGPLSEQSPRKSPRGGVAAHAEIANCSACHAPAWSGETMATRCLMCHDNIRDQLASGKPLHGLLTAGHDCRSCHTEHKGRHAALTNMAHFDHDCAAFKLTGKHRQLECAACHHNRPYQGTPQTCVACHVEPSVHLGKFGTDCQSCHSSATWQKPVVKTEQLVSAGFNHTSTGFALTGKHSAADCKACHTGSTFKGLAHSCVSCHAEPVVHKEKFGTDCKACHATVSWKEVSVKQDVLTAVGFNHNATAFKLTDKHARTDCKSCHVKNTFKGTPTSCVSCHAEPVVHLGKFGTDCKTCHATASWKSVVVKHDVFTAVGFDHSTTAFKLTGKHAGVDCKSCHTGQSFKGTPSTCVSCHAEPISHKPFPKSFGSDCVQCHTTASWQGATLARHTFPIKHGSRKNKGGVSNACTVCHKDTFNVILKPDALPTPIVSYATYTCYGCHTHAPEREARRHAGRRGVTDLNKCASCHKTGRGHERRGALQEAFPFAGAEASQVGAAADLFAQLGPRELPAWRSSAAAQPMLSPLANLAFAWPLQARLDAVRVDVLSSLGAPQRAPVEECVYPLAHLRNAQTAEVPVVAYPRDSCKRPNAEASCTMGHDVCQR